MENQRRSESSKRMRQSNYTLEEKNYLLQLVDKNKHILENKKTDAASNSNKEKTWEKVASEFNSAAPSNNFRNVSSLKKAYLNIKSNEKKDGGYKKRLLIQETLKTMNNTFDSDTFLPKTGINVKEIDELSESPIEEIECIYIETEEHDSSNNTNDFDKTNGSCEESASESVTNGNEKSRVRPTTVALHNEMHKLYSQKTKLCEARLEIIQLEKSILKNRISADKVKQELEIEILSTELEIKKQQLKNMMKN